MFRRRVNERIFQPVFERVLLPGAGEKKPTLRGINLKFYSADKIELLAAATCVSIIILWYVSISMSTAHRVAVVASRTDAVQ